MPDVKIIPIGVHAACDIYRCQRTAKYAIGRECGSLRPYFKLCPVCAAELAQAFKDSPEFTSIYEIPEEPKVLTKAKPGK